MFETFKSPYRVVFQSEVKQVNLFSNIRLCAFSLVEMLMALLVASLLMAALSPVMTKKMKEKINVAGVSGGGRAPAVF